MYRFAELNILQGAAERRFPDFGRRRAARRKFWAIFCGFCASFRHCKRLSAAWSRFWRRTSGAKAIFWRPGAAEVKLLSCPHLYSAETLSYLIFSTYRTLASYINGLPCHMRANLRRFRTYPRLNRPRRSAAPVPVSPMPPHPIGCFALRPPYLPPTSVCAYTPPPLPTALHALVRLVPCPCVHAMSRRSLAPPSSPV